MGHPLLCWDIVSMGMNRREDFSADLRLMNQLRMANKWSDDYPRFDNSLIWENKIILITDINLRIVTATKNILSMNGYSAEEVISKTPEIFQGEKTSSTAKKKIGKAIQEQRSFEVDILNYRKDGSLYHCRIEGHPVFNKKGSLVNFMAFENLISI